MTKKIMNITLSIILFLLPLIIFPPSIYPRNYNIPKIILLYSCGLILLICLFIKHKELTFDKIDKILLAFIFLVFISTIFSVNIEKSIFGENNRHEGLLSFICYYLIYYCAKYYFKPNQDTINTSLFLMSITSILGILQYYNVPIIHEIFKSELTGDSFAASTFGNRNFFASFISICLPYVMCLYIFYHKKIYLFVTSISFYALLVSLTRSAWLAFFVFSIIGIIYIIKLKNEKILKNAGIVLLIFVVLFAIFYFTNPSTFLGRYRATVTDLKQLDNPVNNKKFASGRNLIWSSALRVVKSNPLIGCGPDAFLSELKTNHAEYLSDELYPKLKSFPDKVHNEFLQIAATIGIPALILYLLFLFKTLKKIINQNFKKNRKAFILFLCLISYLVQAFFNVSTIGVAPLFYFLLGYSYQLNKTLTLKENNNS